MQCTGTSEISNVGEAPAAAVLSELDKRLLDGFQRDFPLVSRPFAELAERLGASEAEVLESLRRLSRAGLVSRVGPVFRPNRVGASTLAAMAVPSKQLEEVAALVNGYPEVNHNYAREHAYNLWFVVTAPDRGHLDQVLRDMERRTGLAVLDLPMLEAYHLDLGFRMDLGTDAVPQDRQVVSEGRCRHPDGPAAGFAASPIGADDRRVVAAIQHGLPLLPEPFAAAAEEAGLGEAELFGRLEGWLQDGTLNRFGVVVRHRELGYRANAMVVWDVPDDQVSILGHRMGSFDFVTLCYRRPRRTPAWGYNLFCMIHGRDRETVLGEVARLVAECDLDGIDHQVLFSVRRFKQRGARYQAATTEGRLPVPKTREAWRRAGAVALKS